MPNGETYAGFPVEVPGGGGGGVGSATLPQRLVLQGVGGSPPRINPTVPASGNLVFTFPPVPPGKRWFVSYVAIDDGTADRTSAQGAIIISSQLIAWIRGTRTYTGPFVLEQSEVLQVSWNNATLTVGDPMTATMWVYQYNEADALPFVRAVSAILSAPTPAPPIPSTPGVSAGAVAIPVFVSGRFYANIFGNDSTASLATTNLSRAWIPFSVPEAVTFDRIGVQNVTVGSGTTFRLGIYNDNGTAGNHYPGSLLLDAGTVAAGAAGFLTITIAQAMTAGLYWLAVHVTAASGNTRCRIGGAPSWPSLGWAASLVETTNAAFVQTGIAAATLPDPAPAGMAVGTASNIPEVVVRAA